MTATNAVTWIRRYPRRTVSLTVIAAGALFVPFAWQIPLIMLCVESACSLFGTWRGKTRHPVIRRPRLNGQFALVLSCAFAVRGAIVVMFVQH
jgi:hypothetical protein